MLDQLRTLLGETGLLTEASDRAAYESGWRYGKGVALGIARPRTADEVAQTLALAKAAGVRVQPIGANTGLVGASNPDASGEQLVISLERLSRSIEVDPVGRTATVDAGVTLSQLNAALEPHGLFFPIDLGADPQIGGMIATNTGGTRLLRYGAVRDNLLGLEVALPDGSLWSHLTRLDKDNRGLDAKQLFVGTSGSYGIVTRAVLALAPLPKQTVTAWVSMASGAAVLALLAHLERNAGGTLSAFEVLSRDALEITLRYGANIESPFSENLPTCAVLVELSTTLSAAQLDLDELLLEMLEAFLTDNEDDVEDVVPLAPHRAWSLRHQVSESLRHAGHVLALDISVPRSSIAEFSAAVRAELATGFPNVRVCDFGHWGDGGTHLNLVWEERSAAESSALTEQLQTLIYERCVRDFGGSFSAEHGVGPHNAKHYERLSDEHLLGVCRALKQYFDPEARVGTVRLGGTR